MVYETLILKLYTEKNSPQQLKQLCHDQDQWFPLSPPFEEATQEVSFQLSLREHLLQSPTQVADTMAYKLMRKQFKQMVGSGGEGKNQVNVDAHLSLGFLFHVLF